MDFATLCLFPCLCEHCRSVVEVNLLGEERKCPKCGARAPTPYDDPRLSEAAGHRVVAQWNVRQELGRELLLTDGRYRCPECGGMSLRFVDSGVFWD